MFNLRKALSNKLIHSGSQSFRLALPHSIQNTGTHVLASGESVQNPSTLISISYSLLKENEALNLFLDISKDTNKTKFFTNAQSENLENLTSYTNKLNNDLPSVDNLSISSYCSAAYILSESGQLTQEYFNENLRSGIEGKIQYASLQNLMDLAVCMISTGFTQEDTLLESVVSKVEEKLQDSTENVTYSGHSTHLYEPIKSTNEDCSTYGNMSGANWLMTRIGGSLWLQLRNRLYYGLTAGDFGITHVFARPNQEQELTSYQSSLRLLGSNAELTE